MACAELCGTLLAVELGAQDEPLIGRELADRAGETASCSRSRTRASGSPPVVPTASVTVSSGAAWCSDAVIGLRPPSARWRSMIRD